VRVSSLFGRTMPVLQSRRRPTWRRLGGNMSKRFIVAWVVLFVAWMIEGFVVHGLLLGADYKPLTQLFRPEADAQPYFGWMLLAHVFLAGAFVWIYERGIATDLPWLGQGARFGVAIALLTVVPTYLIYYVVQPTPGMLVAKQILFDGIGVVLLGILVAFLHRPRPAA
jgi:hypothetical protein